MALEKELAAYKSKLPELMANEGKFALFHGDDLVEIFSAYDDALKFGYAKFQLDPFLVKQIEAVEQAHFFARLDIPPGTPLVRA